MGENTVGRPRADGVAAFEVYVHVPFCLRRCGYCDFNTYTATDLGGGASREHYADLAIGEMETVARWQEAHGVREPAASTVFFGGGTPTILPADDLIRMVRSVDRIWGLAPGAEITTEANPDTVDPAYLARLKEGGITRVSFGMQSAVPKVLKTLDRTHTPANVASNVAAARKVGLECSVDLIYGTPGEGLEDWRTSLQAALDLGVDHVSAYALTLEPTTKMGRAVRAGRLAGPDDDDEAAKYELADDMLTAAGLHWYEISNWARPGHESRHNLGYWRNVDWAGIGPGAHSHYNLATLSGHLHQGGGPSRAGQDRGSFRRTQGEDRHAGGAGDLGVAIEEDRLDTAPDPSTLPGGGTDPSRGLPSAPMRAWDLAHPRKWAEALTSGRVPWAGSEVIGPAEAIEEAVMLGLRLSEGLDLASVERRCGRRADPDRIGGLISQGLVCERSGRLIPTRRGRLVNDLVVQGVLEAVGMW